MKDEVLDEAANRVLSEGSGDGGAQTEAATKTASDVVFAAAFPDIELARGMNTALARVEAEHDFAEADAIPAAIRFGNLKRFHGDKSIP